MYIFGGEKGSSCCSQGNEGYEEGVKPPINHLFGKNTHWPAVTAGVTVINSISRVRKLKLREMRVFAQGHTVSN